LPPDTKKRADHFTATTSISFLERLFVEIRIYQRRRGQKVDCARRGHDAVLDISTNKQNLQNLDEAKLFLIPLDGKRNWYRYHHYYKIS
jgi:LuxR family maltose regulon positive regulatory protein